MNNSKRNIALVTGASRGLGYEVAKLLAQKGIHIIGLARTVGALESLSDEIKEGNGTSTMVPIHLENDAELNNLTKMIFDRWKKIDILVHCASIATPMSPVVAVSFKDFDKSLAINTRATLKLIHNFDPLIRVSNLKTVIFLDDQHKGKFLCTYSASKSATREIIYSYKEESRRIGANVIIFTPKPMPTSLRARFYPGEDRNKLSSCLSQAKLLISQANL